MQELIIITLEEYKELLVIKGKYEEKKKQEIVYVPYSPNITTTTYPYKITCHTTLDENKCTKCL